MVILSKILIIIKTNHAYTYDTLFKIFSIKCLHL